VLAGSQQRHAGEHASLSAVRAAIGAGLLLLLVSPARAEPEPEPEIPGVHDFFVGVEVGRVADRETLDARATIALAVSIHERLGLAKTGLAWGCDLALGSTSSGGFLYGIAYRIGIGLRLGDGGQFSVTTGAGLGGITGGRLGFAWTIPTDAYLSVALPHGQLRAIAGATGTWLFTENARQSGAVDAPPFDEVTARIGLLRPTWGVQLFVSEMRGTRVFGVALGVAERADRLQ
jgi:hypothetical protein